LSRTSPTRATFLVSALFTFGMVGGAGTGYAAAARAQDPYHDLERFADVLWRIENNYVEERSTDELIDAAIRGMMADLDEHSRWLSADEARDLEQDTQGSYEGIGVEVRQAGDAFTIARVLPNGPAQYAGLAAGDKIVAVDGEPLSGLSLDDLSEKLKGPRGEEVTLSVVRQGWDLPQEIPTIRDRIHTPSVEGELLPGNVAYLHLWQFQKGAAEDLRKKADELGGGAPPAGIVLDLRDNPGGLLEEAVAVSDLFLDEGPIVSTRGRIEGSQEFDATPGGFPAAMPVVILVNGMSASASEIVSGALQDTHRGLLVGEQTYGKGSVQTLYSYPDDSALKLTIAHYYTPSGQPVADHHGRLPDIPVEFPAGTAPAVQLRAKIAANPALSDGDRADMLALMDALPAPDDEAPVPWDLHGTERMEADPQLRAALAAVNPR
jgi:carboxyl-terminal processing protease